MLLKVNVVRSSLLLLLSRRPQPFNNSTNVDSQLLTLLLHPTSLRWSTQHLLTYESRRCKVRSSFLLPSVELERTKVTSLPPCSSVPSPAAISVKSQILKKSSSPPIQTSPTSSRSCNKSKVTSVKL